MYNRINSICLPVFISDLDALQLLTGPPTTLPHLLSSFIDDDSDDDNDDDLNYLLNTVKRHLASRSLSYIHYIND